MTTVKARRRCGATVAAFLMGIALGCGGDDSAPVDRPASASSETAPAAAAPAAKASSADASAEAKEIFATRCFTCHGASGAGDGPGSSGLTPAPRNFQDPAWQAEVSDEHIANIIMYGGSAVGRSPTMPGNPDLSAKPDVVAALVAYVRGLKSE